jgi:hypothetical protein
MALALPRKNMILVDMKLKTNIIFLPDITAILLKFYKNKAKPFSVYKPTNMVFKKTIFNMYCLYLNLFYRPPHVSSNYHKRTVYVVSWGPQCIKTGTYTSMLVWYSKTRLNRTLNKPEFCINQTLNKFKVPMLELFINLTCINQTAVYFGQKSWSQGGLV